MILKNLDKNWNAEALSDNPSITFEMILQIKDIINLDWYKVSQNKNITLQIIQEHPELQWHKHGLAGNKNIPFEYFEDKIPEGFPWYHCKNITIKDIVKYQDKNTKWEMISFNKNITMDDIDEHPEFPWSWGEYVCWNPNLTIDMAIKHQEAMWWGAVSANKAITMDIIEEYPNLLWDYECISFNENLTIDMIFKNLDKEWVWSRICANPAMTLDIIVAYNHLPWEWDNLSMNKNLTSDFVLNNLDKNWDIRLLSANSMHNYRREKKIIRDRIQEVLNVNRLLREMKDENSYFKTMPKDIVNLISVYY
jgi:hypothetical protein